jgi:hypothetical protein
MHAGLLLGRSSTAREQWCLNPHLLAIVNHFLRTTNPADADRISDSQRSTDALLSQAACITIVEGGEAQPLHRDDAIWQKVHTSQEQTGYRLGSDLGIGMLLAAVDTTRANGATLVRNRWMLSFSSLPHCRAYAPCDHSRQAPADAPYSSQGRT